MSKGYLTIFLLFIFIIFSYILLLSLILDKYRLHLMSILTNSIIIKTNICLRMFMEYKYAENINYEDFASGRVFYHRAASTNYPVRLASEVFSRCMSYLNKENGITIYDPCCGNGYLLTVLGYLYTKNISAIYGSDISEEAIEIAVRNLSLLSNKGLEKRELNIQKMINEFNKPSHYEALESIQRFKAILESRDKEAEINCFITNILDIEALKNAKFKADIIFMDVPYGNLVEWSSTNKNNITLMLETIKAVISSECVIAISSDKHQKIKEDDFIRIEKMIIGKRKIELLRMKGD